MSIAEKIAALQGLQRKIDCYQMIHDEISTLLPEDAGNDDLAVVDAIKEFCKKQITVINQPDKPTPAPKAAKAKTEKAVELTKDTNADIPTDPLRFAMKYRALEGKPAKIPTGGGEKVLAYIRGVSPPNVVVETESGHTVQVPPEDLEIQNA